MLSLFPLRMSDMPFSHHMRPVSELLELTRQSCDIEREPGGLQRLDDARLAAEVEELEAAYPGRRKCRTQKQAGYVEFLRDSYLPVREAFLNILKAELDELDQELEKSLMGLW